MNLGCNRNVPLIMHIDLNSCFARIEQQANPLLRGKPIVVAAYASPNGCVVSPSVEAKQLGIKTGMTVREARLLCPRVTVLTPDPPKYRDVHTRFCRIFRDYSSAVVPKSIDEAVIDFRATPHLAHDLIDLAHAIKERMRREIGEWITCSIGIGPNRFLAKTAASLKKPDGLEVITAANLEAVYARLELIDLCGINTRYAARLNIHGIFTPLQFLAASEDILRRQVFKSVVGSYWYARLRGWEIDDVDYARKSFGQSYALGQPTADPDALSRLLLKLCEKMGRRLRKAGYAARGIHVACVYRDGTSWHQGRHPGGELYATQELYRQAQLTFNRQPARHILTHLAVSCFDLVPSHRAQLTLFDLDDAQSRHRRLSDALDAINDRYGEYVITPARMLGMDDLILDRISFGSVRDLEDLYAAPAT